MSDLIWPIGALIGGLAALHGVVRLSRWTARRRQARQGAPVEVGLAALGEPALIAVEDDEPRPVYCSVCLVPLRFGMEHRCRKARPLTNDATAVMRAVGLGEEQR